MAMQFKNLLIFLLGQLICALNTSAQDIDSLLREFDAHKTEDTLTLNRLLLIADRYIYIFPDKGIQFSDKAIVLAEKLNMHSHLAASYLKKGENLNARADFKPALEYFEKALVIYKQQNSQLGIAASLTNIGRGLCFVPDYNKAFSYFQKAMEISNQLPNKEQTAKVYSGLGLYYRRLYDQENCIENYQKALEIYNELSMGGEYIRILSLIGMAYLRLRESSKALEHLQKSLKLSEQSGNKAGMAFNYQCLGALYYDAYQFPNSLKYYQNALVRYEQLDGQYYILNILSNIGNIYTALADSARVKDYHQKALEFYLKALRKSEQLNSQSDIALNLGNLAFNYILSSDFLKAMECLQKALKINQEKTDHALIADNLETIALIYYTAPDNVLISLEINPSDKYSQAIEKLKTAFALFKQIGSITRQAIELLRIHDVYIKANRFDSAYTYFSKYIVLRDSIDNVEKQKRFLATELKYEFGKKEDSLKFSQQFTDEQLKRQVLIAKQQQQQLALSEKDKDLQKLAYMKTQSDLQNEQLLKQEKEKQLTIVEKEKQLQSVQVTTLSHENDLNKLKRRQQWFYSIGVLVLLTLLGSYFFYLNRLKQGKLKMELAKEKAEQEKKEAEFQRSLADISLTALRSQMNPHFIFNCLNSIKLYTTQNETVAASEYLTKFSRLIRLVMENSRNDRISLTAELEALRLYIEMEAMRFKEKLSYNISVDKDVEMDYVEIPPLLLQPYVENAIWHGLMHKEQGGRIDVAAAMKKDESLLEINITDNGVGRAKAEELRSKTATRHKSYGMKVTSERIALINQIYKTGANVAIYDVTNGSGEVAGTRVVIQIPV